MRPLGRRCWQLHSHHSSITPELRVFGTGDESRSHSLDPIGAFRSFYWVHFNAFCQPAWHLWSSARLSLIKTKSATNKDKKFKNGNVFMAARRHQCLTQLVITGTKPSDCDAATNAAVVPALEILLAPEVAGSPSRCRARIQMKLEVSREARETCGPDSWKDKNKDEASPQWHAATWQQEVKIKVNSCSFFLSSFQKRHFLKASNKFSEHP